MVGNRNPRSETIESFVQVIRYAKLCRRAVDIRPLRDLELDDRADRAKQWVIAYATECLAREVHKQAGELTSVFALHVQARFEAVGEFLDQHLEPGPDEIDRRRALLERAEVFCRFSPHFDEQIDKHDIEAMADVVNEREARRAVYKFLFCRDIGRLVALPAYTGGPDEDFTPSAAKELIDRLDSLHRVLEHCITRMKPVFDDPRRDSVPLSANAVADLIRQIGDDIAARPPENTLQRAIDR
jgi:protein tyrosine phosphatase (PTP) superfamily phosphohydrolase (DUF442 family)